MEMNQRLVQGAPYNHPSQECAIRVILSIPNPRDLDNIPQEKPLLKVFDITAKFMTAHTKK